MINANINANIALFQTFKHLFPHETTITKYVFPNENCVVLLGDFGRSSLQLNSQLNRLPYMTVFNVNINDKYFTIYLFFVFVYI